MRVFFTVCLSLLANVSIAAENAEVAWSYAQSAEWGKLTPAFALCETGDQQSPVNIVSNELIKLDLDPIEFKYIPFPLHWQKDAQLLRLSVERGGMFYAGCSGYRLSEVQFRAPSEVTIDGKSFDFAVHFVHESEEGKMLVAVVHFNKGEANPVLEALWKSLNAPDAVAQASLNLLPLTPTDTHYYTFGGSLSTPPCTENVRWVVLKEVMTLSEGQYAAYRQLYPQPNARPTQALHDRRVATTLTGEP